ncbi:oxygenase MpaB family protein [Tsuneonella rigui]|uniref:oxygenase MpaB family protein n=1 Tax=Tsuneonella rigui TaxID=1708790 RepID=UPI001F49ECBD|nr:oxygenase MpaB family protein [Tsuneonella rigui]
MNQMTRVKTMPTIDFSRPKGEKAYLAPDSIQWKVFKNPVALAVGGVAAVLLEFADARIRSGVWDHSIYKVDPIGRSQRTGMAAMVGVYGPKSVARQVIGGVNRMHAKVAGKTPSGEDYRALDPELLNWVSATAQYGFLTAYDRFVRRLPSAEKDRFWHEGTAIAELYGVTEIPHSEADFHRMMERLLPRFEPHPINREFLEIIQSGRAAPSVPRFLHRSLARAAVSIVPRAVRERLELGREFDLTLRDRVLVKAMGRLPEHVKDRSSPAWQAAERMGLPGDTAWKR